MSKGYIWGLFEYDIYKANADGSNLAQADRARRATTPRRRCARSTARSSSRRCARAISSCGGWTPTASNLRQLTNSPGYDGGAFFSADCTKIVWRASRPQGKDLEEYKALLAQNLVKPTKMDIWVANADGTEAHQVTYLPGASFAPYFYPERQARSSSRRTTSRRAAPSSICSRSTSTARTSSGSRTRAGFDGFPVFSPDGKTLAFSSNRRDVVKSDSGRRLSRHRRRPRASTTRTCSSPTGSSSPPRPDEATEPRDRSSPTRSRRGEVPRRRRARRPRHRHEGPRRRRRTGSRSSSRRPASSRASTAQWRQPFEVTTEVKRGAKTALADRRQGRRRRRLRADAVLRAARR